MKIAIAQIESEIGDIEANLKLHAHWAYNAATKGARLIVFPELSLTGYAPELAQSLAMEVNDQRLDFLQDISNQMKISIALGIPIKTADKPQIGMVIIEPHEPRKLYGKQYLHADELTDFSPGENYHGPFAGRDDIAFCVCYELSVDAHADKACDMNAAIYLASVAKTPSGVASASARLAGLSKKNGFVTMMCNCVGICEGQSAGGGSAVWNDQGELMAQLNDQGPGLILYDSRKNTCFVISD